ncbi:P22 coat protein - protein 5 domain protein [Micromonospora sp. NPDC047730]|uniref:phage major capsid protein n=1 Tax=Micromonospora sp. NPDC047730 TaxID=3364253 RepID=UPI003722DDB6
MAVDTFIPEVWNAELLTDLETRYVFAQGGVINRDYEGDIAEAGDTVHINSLGDVTISNYVKNVTKIDPQTLTTTDQTMVIDQSKYFAFEVDDVDARQVKDSGQLMTKSARNAARGLARTADGFLSALMVASAGTVLTPAAVSTPDAAYLLVRKMWVALEKNDVPDDGRFLIVSPDFYALILGDDRFIDASKYGSTEPIRNGEVGRVLNFTVMRSNTIPAGTSATSPAVSNFVIAGHEMATTFAEQIAKTEAYRPQDSFSDAIKGLHLYGGKVVRPEALVVQDTDVTVG